MSFSRPTLLKCSVATAAVFSCLCAAQLFTADEPFARSMFFDGGTTLWVDDHPDLPPGSAITLEAWGRRESDQRCETVVGKDFTSSYWLGFCNGPIRFYSSGNGSSIDGNTTIAAGRWTHIAITYDDQFRRYYVNGVLDLDEPTGGGAAHQ